jgi:myosin heavy subunit
MQLLIKMPLVIKTVFALQIMDCPGLFDTSRSHEDVAADIVRAVACMHPGPHAVLYVVRLGRYTREEFDVYQRLTAIFDENIKRYMIVIFTGADDLEKNGKSLGEVLSHLPEDLAQVMDDCSRRAVAFNNVAKNKSPYVKNLLQEVDGMLKMNGGQHYECPKYAGVGVGMKEEVARRLRQLEEQQLASNKHVQQLKNETQTIEGQILQERRQLEESQKRCEQRMQEEETKAKMALEQLGRELQQKNVSLEQQEMEMQKLRAEHLAEKQKLEEEWKQLAQESEAQLQKMQQNLVELRQHLQQENAKAAADARQHYEKEIREMKERIAKEPKPPNFLQSICNSVKSIFTDVVMPAVTSVFAKKITSFHSM